MTAFTDKLLATNPIGAWFIDDAGPTALDSSGNGYNGTGSGAGLTWQNDIGPDGALVPTFSGVSGTIDLTTPGGIEGAYDGSTGTVLACIKTSAWADGSFRDAFHLRVNASNQIRLRKSNASELEWVYEAAGVSKIVTKSSMTETDWIIVAMTWDKPGANSMRAFYQGIQEGSDQLGIGVWAGVPTAVDIGSRQAGLFNRWVGSIGPIVIWDKVLSDATILDLADASEPPAIVPEPLPPIPLELYDILVYDHTGTLQLLLQKWSRLEFHQRLNAPWNHQITLEYGYDDPDLATIRNILNDWIIEVYRIDPVTLVRTKVYEGFNVTIVDQVRANGGIILNLYGVGYTQLLQRRIVVPPAGQEYATKTGLAESVIKSFVADSMVSPLDANRIFNGVTVAADSGAGNIITFSARYTNLLSVCETVSEQGNLDYGIIGGSEVGEFIFDARGLWGNDYREGNTAGNIPIIFSIERDNMLIPILSLNYSAEQNFMYVGGEGQGAERVIQEVQNSAAIATSPWGRKESFVESRSQNSVDALVAAGQTELEARKAKQALSFSIRQTDSSRWIRDWNLGDLITAKYYEYAFDRQIVDIGVLVSSGASNYETITVKFEDLRI
jgi:hypothetical protein